MGDGIVWKTVPSAGPLLANYNASKLLPTLTFTISESVFLALLRFTELLMYNIRREMNLIGRFIFSFGIIVKKLTIDCLEYLTPHWQKNFQQLHACF